MVRHARRACARIASIESESGTRVLCGAVESDSLDFGEVFPSTPFRAIATESRPPRSSGDGSSPTAGAEPRPPSVPSKHHDRGSPFAARNTSNIAPTSVSSRFTSGICDIVIRMSGNAFCSCCLDVFSSNPVRETVRESSESGELPAVRFPPPPLFWPKPLAPSALADCSRVHDSRRQR